MKYIYVDLNTAKSNPPKGEVLTSDTRLNSLVMLIPNGRSKT